MKISQESRAGAWRAPCPSFTFRKGENYRPIIWITPPKGAAEKRYSLPVGIFFSGGEALLPAQILAGQAGAEPQ